MDHSNERKNHWESIYARKAPTELSWYQDRPGASLDLLQYTAIPRTARVIDVGGGDSRFVDFLLDEGFTAITVLDISETAIERARLRLGNRSQDVTWIVADIRDFSPAPGAFDLWHDRAVLHFLKEETDLQDYILKAKQALSPQGKMIIGTFSERGPERCSGLPVQRYSELSLTERLSAQFQKIKCIIEEHRTPAQVIQEFLFCAFKARTTAPGPA